MATVLDFLIGRSVREFSCIDAILSRHNKDNGVYLEERNFTDESYMPSHDIIVHRDTVNIADSLLRFFGMSFEYKRSIEDFVVIRSYKRYNIPDWKEYTSRPQLKIYDYVYNDDKMIGMLGFRGWFIFDKMRHSADIETDMVSTYDIDANNQVMTRASVKSVINNMQDYMGILYNVEYIYGGKVQARIDYTNLELAITVHELVGRPPEYSYADYTCYLLNNRLVMFPPPINYRASPSSREVWENLPSLDVAGYYHSIMNAGAVDHVRNSLMSSSIESHEEV